MRTITLKPSLFIIHDVKHSGGIQYRISDRESETEDRTERTNWKTERTISDLDAFNAARATRSRIENLMRSETGAAVSDITGGMFAPDAPETWEALEAAQLKIQEEIETYRRDFDGGNRLTSRVIVFRITGENRQILEALRDQIADGLEALKAAVMDANPDRIRAALKSLKGMDKVLNPEAAARLAGLMDTYRAKAREITAAVKKQGKSIDELRQEMNASPIDAAELAIFEDAPDTIAPLPAIDAAEFQTEEAETAAAPAPPTPGALEFETDQTEERAAAPATLDGLETDTTPAPDPDQWDDPCPRRRPDPDPDHGAPMLDLDAMDAEAITPAAAAALIRQDAREARAPAPSAATE